MYHSRHSRTHPPANLLSGAFSVLPPDAMIVCGAGAGSRLTSTSPLERFERGVRHQMLSTPGAGGGASAGMTTGRRMAAAQADSSSSVGQGSACLDWDQSHAYSGSLEVDGALEKFSRFCRLKTAQPDSWQTVSQAQSSHSRLSQRHSLRSQTRSGCRTSVTLAHGTGHTRPRRLEALRQRGGRRSRIEAGGSMLGGAVQLRSLSPQKPHWKSSESKSPLGQGNCGPVILPEWGPMPHAVAVGKWGSGEGAVRGGRALDTGNGPRPRSVMSALFGGCDGADDRSSVDGFYQLPSVGTRPKRPRKGGNRPPSAELSGWGGSGSRPSTPG